MLVLALDGVDGDAEVLHEAGGDVVLGRERVGGDQDEVGAAGLERAGQVGRLGRHVQAGRHPQAGQRLLGLEPLADRPQHGHVALGPDDPLLADGGQREVFHVPFGGRCSRGCQFEYLLEKVTGSSGRFRPGASRPERPQAR